MVPDDLAVVILAGGNATRFPGKLESDVGGTPLLLRVYRNVAPIATVYVSARAGFSPAIDAQLACAIVIDRLPGRGPLGGLVSTFGEIAARRVFVVAADAPFVDTGVYEELARHWDDRCEAVVPVRERDGRLRLEPLCAIYDRIAFLREGYAVLTHGSAAVAEVVDRLRARRVRLASQHAFTNVNTSADAAVLA